MTDQIIDSKFRIVETLPRVAGRTRYVVTDLISGHMAVLEHVPLEGFEKLRARWAQHWQPELRERAERFASLDFFVPVNALGAWKNGPYYVFDDDDEDSLQGNPPQGLPSQQQVRALLEGIAIANGLGDHVLNLRPEHLRIRDGRLQILPGAYVLSLELLARSGARSPYQPPELRHAGQLSPMTDGYLVGAVLQALAERGPEARPKWWTDILHLQVLEPHRRATPQEVLGRWESSSNAVLAPPILRRSVERLADLQPPPESEAEAWSTLIETFDGGLTRLAEGHSTVLIVEAPEGGAGLRDLFLKLHERLCLLSERPEVVWLDTLTSLETRDVQRPGGRVILAPDYCPSQTELLPVTGLLASEKARPAVLVLGTCRGMPLPEDAAVDTDMTTWMSERCGPDVSVKHYMLEGGIQKSPSPPTSPVARYVLDLISVLEADCTSETLRMALPQQEANLPEALAELEALGHLRRVLHSGGWWGSEPRLVLRVLRPDALERQRQSLTVHRREELHLLLSHLLADVESNTLGQRYLRFHHLFAGGNWDGAAAECGPLLRGVQKRGLGALMRQIQRKLVNSNLAHHFTMPHLLEVLRSLGKWEVSRNRSVEGQRYYERAAERLFAVTDEEAAALDLQGLTDMLLAHADLLEKRGDFERALELLQRYLERFDDRIAVVERGRLFSEMGFCEYKLGRFNSAEERCQVALKLLDSRRDPKDAAQVYSIQGLIRWKTSRYDEAEQYFNSSMALREKMGDRLAMARTYNNLGLLERSRRRFPEALEFHRRSMEIRQELNDQEGVTRTVLNLAWVHYEMQDIEHAEEMALRAVKMSDHLGSKSLRASAKGLLGEIYLGCGRHEEAHEAIQDAISQAREVGDVAELFMDLRKYASLELRRENLESAEKLLGESEVLLPHAGSTLEEANWHLTHGELCKARGELRAAAISYEHAGNNLARLGHAQRAGNVFLTATRLYHESGVPVRARDLVGRARQLFNRDGLVLPKELVDLEATVGESELPTTRVPDSARTIETMSRVCATAANSASDVVAIEQILSEMRALSSAHCAILVGEDGEPHRASVLARDLQDRNIRVRDLVAERPRLFARARQTLLPLSSEDLQDEEARLPFFAIPVEARERSLGCVYLEWSTDNGLPEEGVRHLLRTMVQIIAMILERGEAPKASRSSARVEDRESDSTSKDETSLDDIIGRSAARQAIVDFIRQVRDLEATVLVLGENGTGKDVVARAIHDTGSRRRYPFTSVNCSAIPEGLWEREFFGHERGSFTDAVETKRGYFEAAHRGTLLLDEIGDMPLEMQTRFLRVLEEKSFTKVGGTDDVRVDVRIIAATNRDLETAVESGRFRRDLYHRLNVLSITLPPLRERREDIPELAKHFLDLHAGGLKVAPKSLSGEALRVLLQYHWPGNIRELENAMRGSLVLSDREVIVPELLPAAIIRGDGGEAAGQLEVEEVARWVLDHAAYSPEAPLMTLLERALARQLVEKLGEKTKAARMLGISKPTLYSWLKQS